LRELKNHLSEAITEVEHGEVITITKRGRTVAHILPASRDVSVQDRRAIIDSLDNLAAEIGKHTRPSNIAETIGEIRR
jgi:prevent-host-death family protein